MGDYFKKKKKDKKIKKIERIGEKIGIEMEMFCSKESNCNKSCRHRDVDTDLLAACCLLDG